MGGGSNYAQHYYQPVPLGFSDLTTALVFRNRFACSPFILARPSHIYGTWQTFEIANIKVFGIYRDSRSVQTGGDLVGYIDSQLL